MEYEKKNLIQQIYNLLENIFVELYSVKKKMFYKNNLYKNDKRDL